MLCGYIVYKCTVNSVFYFVVCDSKYQDFFDYVFPLMLLVVVSLLTAKLNVVHAKINYIFKMRTLPWKKILNNDNDTNTDPILFNWCGVVIQYILYCIVGMACQIIIIMFWKYINIDAVHSSLICTIIIIPLLGKIIHMVYDHSILIRDIYFVKYEEIYILCVLTAGLISYIVFNIFSSIYTCNQCIFNYIGISLQSVSLLIICIIMTNGLIYKLNKTLYNSFDIGLGKKTKSAHDISDLLYVKSSNQDLTLGCAGASTPNLSIGVTDIFKMILSDDDGVQLFIEHEFQEYTIENILSFIEFIQYIGMNSDNIEPKYEYTLCDEIPLSSINSDDNAWFQKIKKLYDKYIKEFCELQINIPYNIRADFENNIGLYEFRLNNYQETQPKMVKTPVSTSIETAHETKQKSCTFENDTQSDIELYTPTASVQFGAITTPKSAGFIKYPIITPKQSSQIIPDTIILPSKFLTVAKPPQIGRMVSAPDTNSDHKRIPSSNKLTLKNSNSNNPHINRINFKFTKSSSDDAKQEQSVSLLNEAKEPHKTPHRHTIDNGIIKNPPTMSLAPPMSKQGSYSLTDRIRNNVKQLRKKLHKLKHKKDKHKASNIEFLTKMESAKQVNKDTFNDVIYRTLNVLIRLNGQSIKRFMRTQVCYLNGYKYVCV